MAANALQLYSENVGSPAGYEVAMLLNGYLDIDDDLIPDHYGAYGLLDDSWLIFNTVYRLIESNIVPADILIIDWPVIIEADHMALQILPPAVSTTLEQYALQMLNRIVTEVQSCQPQFGNNFMYGGQTEADRWYDAGVDMIENMSF